MRKANQVCLPHEEGNDDILSTNYGLAPRINCQHIVMAEHTSSLLAL